MVLFNLQNERQCLLHSLKIQYILQLLAPLELWMLPPPSVLLVEEGTHDDDIAAACSSDKRDMLKMWVVIFRMVSFCEISSQFWKFHFTN